jgi:hypothetical protein
MEIKTLDSLFYTIAFIVPGFIILTTKSMFVQERDEKLSSLLLRCLTYSCVNYGLWSWLIYLLLMTDFFAKSTLSVAASLFLIDFISPVIIGGVYGHLLQRDTLGQLLGRFGLRILKPSPTGWDYKFSNIKSGVWIRVTFKDRSRVVGWFDSSSLASGEQKERDIYIEQVWVEDSCKWKSVPRTDGMIIRGGEIKHIEFWKDEDEGDERGQN